MTFIRHCFNLAVLAILSLVVAVIAAPPAAAQTTILQLSDGATLPDFVLDTNGYAFHKKKPFGATSLKPVPQLRFIADPGNVRGGTALHPDSHPLVEQVIKDALRSAGSVSTYEIEWINGVGFAGGWQVTIGGRSLSLGQIGCWLMQYGKDGAVQRTFTYFLGVI